MSKNLYPNSVRIGLMDPSIAQTWAQRILSDGTTVGSIKKGDTINHTTSQPIATGLFCQRIFGPCTDYTCACGQEKIRIGFNPNISPPVCPECRVEWTHASVRRQFLGSIELISPVTHKWFSDSRGAYIPTLLGITPRTFRNVKECKFFFPFSLEKDQNFVKYKTKNDFLESNKTSISPSTKSKLSVSINFRAMQSLQLLVKPKKSLNIKQTVDFCKLQVTENFRDFWILWGPFGPKSLKKFGSKSGPSSNALISNYSSLKNLSKFSDVWRFSNADETSILDPINTFEIKSNKTEKLEKNQDFNNRKSKASYYNFMIKTQEIINEQEKCAKISNFYSLVHAAQWLTLEQRCSYSTSMTQVKSSKLLEPLNNPFFNTPSSKIDLFTYGKKFIELSYKNPNWYSTKVEDPNLTLNLKNLSSKTFYPNISKNQQSKFIINTTKQPANLKKNTLKYVFVLAQKKANKLDSNFFLDKFSILRDSDNIFFKDTKHLKTIFSRKKELRSIDFSKPQLQEPQEKPLSLNKTYIFRNFTKSQKDEQFEIFPGKKEKKRGIDLSRERISTKKVKKYKIGLNSNSKIGLILTKSLVSLGETKAFDGSFVSSPKFLPYQKWELSKHSKEPAESLQKKSFNGNHNLPIRPSYTQSEDYRRQFFKFYGNSSLIQKTDIPIFRYTRSFFNTNQPQRNVEKHRITKKTKANLLSPQAVEVYFSEAKSVAKEQTIKKILSQTGGGGLQTYLGLINLSELVLILQNDLLEIAPRLSRSYATRRILLSIINDFSSNLNLPTYSEGNRLKEISARPKEEVPLINQNSISENKLNPNYLLKPNNTDTLISTIKQNQYDFSTKNSTETVISSMPVQEILEVLEKKSKQVKKEYKAVKKILSDFQNRKNINKRRYKLAFQLLRTMSNPAGMTMSSVPVLPPGLRPIIDVPKIGPITADLNIRYRSLLFALRNLRELAIVDFRNAGAAQASVQEAVDDLLYTGGKTRREKPSSYPNLYKSLAMRLKGKHGRFRGNLLGKRVDYSGRSVIVVGPTLKIHQCGLPFEIAIKLFNPFLIRSLIQRGFCKNVYKAKILIRGKSNKALIWTLCKEVMSEHLVLLNRAPTLHRLGVQGFLPILVSGRAILLHPLVCTGFNADFDGDQMGVHVPLFPQARAEAWKMMWSRNNFLLPSSGEPVLLPSQDMVLGCYYLTSYAPTKPLKIEDHRLFSEKSTDWTFGTKLSMCLLSKPPFPIFNQAKKQFLFKTDRVGNGSFGTTFFSNILRISLDYVALKFRFFTQTHFEFKANRLNLSYLVFFPACPNNVTVLEILQTLYIKQNLSNLESQSYSLSQKQIGFVIDEQIQKYLGEYFNYFKKKKSYFNILFFATKTFSNKHQNFYKNQEFKTLKEKLSRFYCLAKFDQNHKEHALIYTEVYKFKERQAILKNKQETISVLRFSGTPINIAQKQLYFFSSHASKLSVPERIRFWSYSSINPIRGIKRGLINWTYSPRFSVKCPASITNEIMWKKSVVKNQLSISLLHKGPFLKTRGLGTSYVASNKKVLYYKIDKKLKKEHYPETSKSIIPFQILTIKAALNLYIKGQKGIQNIVWIHPNKIFLKKDGTSKQSFVQINSKTSSIKPESQKLENDGLPTTTLELRITPFGKMRLLHPSGIKTVNFQNSLLVPFQEPLKDPIFDTFVRTTIGRLIFNNLLEDIENS